MSAAVPLHEDITAADLRRLAKASRDAGQSRRLLALSEIYDGDSRSDAAAAGEPSERALDEVCLKAEGRAVR